MMLLASSSASAVGLYPGPPPREDTENFMLGENPYLLDDGTAVDPGNNAPGLPDAMTQSLWLPDIHGNRFIKLAPSDYVATAVLDEIDPSGSISPTSPLEAEWDFDITWDGDINGVFWEEALPSFCAEGECDLMKNADEEVKLFFVVWDVRWIEEADPDFLGSPSLLDGFPTGGTTADDPINDPVSDPMHADNSTSLFVPVLNAEGGVGFKMAADPGETVSFSADWLLGENPFATYNGTEFDDNDKARVGYSLFVYRVPEPRTLLLLGSGLVGLAAFRGRRSGA
jgi:hypothetical protein